MKTKRYKKGKGIFFKTRKNSIQKEEDSLESSGWTIIRSEIINYHRKNNLAENWTIDSVDAVLSKYVDIPRNIDELRRTKKWAQYLLDRKSYAKSSKRFMKDILKLKNVALLN